MTTKNKSFFKILLIELAIAIFAIVGYFFNDIVLYLTNKDIIYTDSNCTLNDGSCTAALGDKSLLTASISPMIIYPLQKVTFNLQNINADAATISVSGINMDMGLHKIELVKSQNGFSKEFLLPSCSIRMHWKVDVIVQKKDAKYGTSFKLWSEK